MGPVRLMIASLVVIVHANLIVAQETFPEVWGALEYRTVPRELDPHEVWIDAFDEKICGAAEFRPWQASQSAFGCIDNAGKADPSIHRQNGSSLPNQVEDVSSGLANINEFPSFVQYKVKGTKMVFRADAERYCRHDHSSPIGCDGTEKLDRYGKCVDGKFVCSQWTYYEPAPYTLECSGLLVSKNIVITNARCLYDEVDTIELVFGTNSIEARNSTNNEPIVRKAKKWCWQDGNFTLTYLAVIELDRPIDYIEGKIWPACLKTSQGQRLDSDTKCSSALMCPGEPLKSVAVVLDSYSQFYLDRKLDGRFEECYDGGPIFCYDRCSKEERNRVQAFAVGINLSFGPSLASFLGEPRRDLFDLLSMIQKGGKRKDLKCFVAQN